MWNEGWFAAMDEMEGDEELRSQVFHHLTQIILRLCIDNALILRALEEEGDPDLFMRLVDHSGKVPHEVPHAEVAERLLDFWNSFITA